MGLGTQDGLGEAEAFVAEHGTTSFTMLWDESFETWQEIGITSQPAAVLLAADGTPITGWVGPFPTDEVVRLAAESTASA
ncbi:TlpA family protein disulfide reductase [Ilumatobacter sp.]|uniref:TlpA family protein disulfide reductase n=1 Tax=Ilumatobacter sp. TaxID=1967498 RepID=UPI003C546D24